MSRTAEIEAPDPLVVLLRRAEHLAQTLEGAAPADIMRRALDEFHGRIALVSSFGAESVVLLHLAAEIDRGLPVLFIDTDKHFAQTLDYRDEVIARLGLTNVRTIGPKSAVVKEIDPKGDLWKRDPDACCALRKVEPNERALTPFAAWISGRKRHHGAVRAHLPVVEHDGAHFKVNPLVAWGPSEISAYMRTHDLPSHPLVAQGYPSIGCWPCTSPTEGTDARAGRWAGSGKTECGIHRAAPVARRLVF
ncbi:MAG: phosphoadenylyl-sulfate reductase [Hyphomonadaceae bacterium]